MATAAELMGQEDEVDELPTTGVATEVADAPDENVSRETEQDEEPDEAPEPKQRVGKDGRPRTPDGRRYAKIVDDAQGPGDLGDGPAIAPTPDASPTDTVPAPTAEAAPVKDVPWEFYGRGKTVTIPGAVYRAGHGVFIPEKVGDQDVLGDIRARLVRADSLPEVQARAEHYRQQVETGYTQHALENTAMKEVFGRFTTKEGFDKLVQDLTQFPAELVFRQLVLDLKEKQTEIAAKLQAGGAPMVSDPAEQSNGNNGATKEAVTSAYKTLEDVFESTVRSEWPGITPAQKAELEKLVVDTAPALFERASTDDPHGYWAKGGIAVKRSLLVNTIRGAMNGHQPAVAAPTPVASSARPAAPAKVTPTPTQAPPTGAGAVRNLAGTGTPTKAKPKGSFATRKDYTDYLKSNEV